MVWQQPAPAPPKQAYYYDLAALNDAALVDMEARCLDVAAWWTDRATEARQERASRLDLFTEVVDA